MKIAIKKNLPELIPSILISFALSFPLTGFLHGFIMSTGSGSFVSELKGRLFIGVFEAVASAMSYGKPWGDGSEVASLTIQFRILVFLVFIILTILFFKLFKRLSKKLKSLE
ncbi:hypothetical protein [Dokdonia sp.]|uniref:hypothetical protein n=1 Tax=Dokdonia sp. TaxID=2024995 RepID=UPI00326657C5